MIVIIMISSEDRDNNICRALLHSRKANQLRNYATFIIRQSMADYNIMVVCLAVSHSIIMKSSVARQIVVVIIIIMKYTGFAITLNYHPA
jgi:hypothetical protein